MPERKIGQYGDRFNPTIRGLRAYEVKKTKHTLLSLFWLLLLWLWILVPIFLYPKMQELPHTHPSSPSLFMILGLGLWLSIFFIISIEFFANFSVLWVKNEHHNHSKILQISFYPSKGTFWGRIYMYILPLIIDAAIGI